MPFHVTKAFKRLWVASTETGERIYTPPDFINVIGRGEMERLAGELTAGVRYIDAIMAYEAAARRRGRQPCATH